ncbi:hypothetical protein DL96DRAFT_1679287 [Flagelloscypha sp. PMI_526]|nr:hypothetical protein DL96DRAFT_1679287 [Flagelloscypha sp. PMI_526]
MHVNQPEGFSVPYFATWSLCSLMSKPTILTKVDALSGYLRYTGNWARGGHDGDKITQKYDDNTFVYTSTIGDSVRFDFFGSQLYIRNAYRSDNGRYSVTFDNGEIQYFRTDPSKAPSSKEDGSYTNETMFEWTGQTDGHHTVLIQNAAIATDRNSDPATGPTALLWLDLDFVQWTTTVEHAENTTLGPSDSHWTSSTPELWQDATLVQHSSVASRYTTTNGAVSTLRFKGDRVTLYGLTGQYMSNYTIAIDSGTPTTYNATTPDPGSLPPISQDQVLFTAAGLQNSEHTLTLTAQLGPSQSFGYDYAVVDGILNHADDHSHKLSTGGLTGVIVGIVVVLLSAICIGCFLFRRRRRRNHRKRLIRATAMLESELQNPFLDPYLSDRPVTPPPGYSDSTSVVIPLLGVSLPQSISRTLPRKGASAAPLPRKGKQTNS